jgi:uncharacterized protein (DUF4415 family)
MNNINILEKNILDRKKIIDKLMIDPIKNKKLIEDANKYINKTNKKIKKLKTMALKSSMEQKSLNNKKSEELLIDTSERKTISIRIKIGVLNALKKEHPKYQTLINAVLESYVINKKL